MSIPLVTVVVALYNKEQFIGKCIESILGQSIGDLQLIIVNDGSKDNSYEIARSYKDSRITLIDQENSGPGVARNAGLKLCTTKYVAFLDADDHWDSDFLKTAVTTLEEKSECDLFLCGATWEPLGEIRLPIFDGEINVRSGKWTVPQGLAAYQLFEAMNFFATGAVVIKTNIIKQYGGYFDAEFCNSGEDGYLWIQVMFNHVIYRSMQSLLCVNTEGSDLGIGRKKLKPTPPMLLHPQRLYQNCPPSHKASLDKLLAFLAFQSFRRELYQGYYTKAYKLFRDFPELKQYKDPEYPPILRAFIEVPFKKNIVRPFQALVRKFSKI